MSLDPSLGICKKQRASFKVYVLPFEMQNLPEPTAGEQREPDMWPR
jgi:hypothetical protein